MRLRSRPTLEIRTTSDVILLAAEESLPDDSGCTARAPDTIVRGTVVLHLPKPRLVRNLDVSLLGKQLVVIEGLANSYGMRQCSAELHCQPHTFSAGTHECVRRPGVYSDARLGSPHFFPLSFKGSPLSSSYHQRPLRPNDAHSELLPHPCSVLLSVTDAKMALRPLHLQWTHELQDRSDRTWPRQAGLGHAGRAPRHSR